MSFIKYVPAPIGDMGTTVKSLAAYLWRELQKISYAIRLDDLWEDYTAPMSQGKIPAAGPDLQPFGPDGIMEQLRFTTGELVYVNFHVLHDIQRNSKMYPHVHWAMDATATAGTVTQWEICWTGAKGHNQSAFAACQTATVSFTANDEPPWQHIISETSDGAAFDAFEVDSNILFRVKFLGTTSGNNVFGTFVDIHYQKDRMGTRFKAPNFYGENE